ncbi:hypothetical protein SAMN05421788_104180 [Filimonas lacunae]|uniref:Uncharacterized protein n=1 Tax=Filimonas lacunae TaxID=477680 RepID=A0A173M966_9BACT|nr:hypothetical protein [Filimonas lacunae]BAV04084.1 hypothetical protein FLA_0063 [Filimonas lacunae]SIT15626.1 hypothetical protein SAMN05421788_104180 [Filimonas lacunae]
MIFFYGRKSFNAKTVQLSDIGIFETQSDIVQFELRQEYAHLYWIPFFPVGSKWCARKSDNNLYEVNNELVPALDAIPRKKLGWVAFIGPIVLVLIVLVAKLSR